MSVRKRPVATVSTELTERVDHRVDERFGVLGRGGLDPARAAALGRVAVERELADHEHRSADVDDRAVHHAVVVVEDPQAGDLVGEPIGDADRVGVGDADEHAQAGADRPDDLRGSSADARLVTDARTTRWTSARMCLASQPMERSPRTTELPRATCASTIDLEAGGRIAQIDVAGQPLLWAGPAPRDRLGFVPDGAVGRPAPRRAVRVRRPATNRRSTTPTTTARARDPRHGVRHGVDARPTRDGTTARLRCDLAAPDGRSAGPRQRSA